MGGELLDELYRIETLDGLATWLAELPTAEVRKTLVSEFLGLCRYRDASEWNRAVRVCEALAIVGWGECEPVEAIASVFWSGNPETFFQNRLGERRFISAIWSKRKEGLSIDGKRSHYFASPDLPGVPSRTPVVASPEAQPIKLQTQRNWIARNPIRVSYSCLNCLPGSETLNLDVEYVLRPMLDHGMRRAGYGGGLCQLLLEYSLDFDLPASGDGVLDGDRASVLRDPPYKLGRFSSKFSTQAATIYFSRAFSQQSTADQKRELKRQLLIVLDMLLARLRAKRLEFDFDAVWSDFERIVTEWSERDSDQFIAELPEEKNHYAMFRKMYGRSL